MLRIFLACTALAVHTSIALGAQPASVAESAKVAQAKNARSASDGACCCCAPAPSTSDDTPASKALAELYKAQAEHANRLAEETIKDVDRQVAFLSHLWSTLAAVGGIVVAALAFFGIKGVTDVWRIRKKMIEDYGRITAEFHDLSAQYNVVLETARGNQEAMLQCLNATRVIDSVPTMPLLADTAKRLEKVLTEGKADDPSIRAWAYHLYAFLEYSLGNTVAALDAVKKSLALVEDSPDANYNAACYAALLGQKAEALLFFARAIALRPGYKDQAVHDADLESMKDDPEFLRIIASG